MRKCRSWRTVRTVLLGALSLCLFGSVQDDAEAQTLTEDTFVAQVRGDWLGSGEYDGNALTLTRSWTLELQDQFLRADMRVGMPNGAAFGAVMYWKAVSLDVYEVVWMDGIGRHQTLRATRDPDSGLVSTTFLDQFTENGSEWRTWEFESLGPTAYVERLYRIVADGREELAEFSFTRNR